MKPIGTHNYFVYILTNKNKTVLYFGITEDLKKRLYYHQSPISEPNRIPFTTKYACYYLVYYERFEDVSQAIDREKQIKKWSRLKKESLINAINRNGDSSMKKYKLSSRPPKLRRRDLFKSGSSTIKRKISRLRCHFARNDKFNGVISTSVERSLGR